MAISDKNCWSLSTDDTEITITVVNDRPVIKRLCARGRKRNWISQIIPISLMTKVGVKGKQISTAWHFKKGIIDKNIGQLTLVFINKEPKLVLRSIWRARLGHGPIEHWIEIDNLSDQSVTVFHQDSLHLLSLNTGAPAVLWWVKRGGNDARKQGGTFTASLKKNFDLNLSVGPSGPKPIPWMAVQVNSDQGLYVGWEFSGNGRIHVFTEKNKTTLNLKIGSPTNFRFKLKAGKTFFVPPAFVGCYLGDVDDGSYCLHRFFIKKLRLSMPKGCPDPILTYNIFFDGRNEASLLKSVEFAYKCGFEAFVIDAIWFSGDWGRYKGPWIWDTRRYPNGIKPIQKFCRSKGMKIGLWCAWGKVISQAKKITHKIVSANNLDYFKHDLEMISDGSYENTIKYYEVQEALRKSFPKLILENCSDGGTIKDYGAMRRAHYIVTTDVLSSLPNRMSIYDSTYAMPPLVLQCYTWLRDDPPGPYLWRSAMMGAWVIDIPRRPKAAALIKRATHIYKSWIRPILIDCKVYHILPRPDGKHWDGMFYWSPKLKKGILYIFRPNSNVQNKTVKLKGLRAESNYWLWCEDGSVSSGKRTGKNLMETGLSIKLPSKYTSDLIFIQSISLGTPKRL
jgi:alpha-galactosidase